jgi:propionate CoA-transferase
VVDLVTLTAEPGVVGGIPASGLNFGAATNTQAIIDQPYQFDFYDGGGLDQAFLGLAQADRHGNLNVSKFGQRLAGAGGFINISQTAKAVYFVGTFMAGEAEIAISDAGLRILKEGGTAKFVEEVEHRTFSGAYALKRGQPVLYITERCVMQLTPEGMEVIEIAPGIDLDRDILARMAFRPIVKNPRLMDQRLFREDLLGLRDAMLALPIARRFSYDAAENLFFINFERLSLKTLAEIEEIRASVTRMLGPLGRRVKAIANYDHFTIPDDLMDEYAAMVASLTRDFYSNVTRYTTSGFLRMKLGSALQTRGAAPQIYDTVDEARARLGTKS